jgi:glycosyltransferase involved in cell wall biosynthesis
VKVLFLTQGPIQDASARQRVYAYIPHLLSRGVVADVSPAVDSAHYEWVFRKSLHHRLRLMQSTVWARLKLLPLIRRYDVIVIQREFVARFFPMLEFLYRLLNPRIVFDIDDNVYQRHTMRSPSWLGWLQHLFEDRHAAERITRWSAAVTVGSPFLYQRASEFNASVTLLPTCVDLAHTPVKIHHATSFVTVGWIGSPSSSQYIAEFVQVLLSAYRVKPFRLLLIGTADAHAAAFGDFPSLELRDWKLENEFQDLLEIDVGLMPLQNDEWAQGKCGFKAIQYLASGIPAICSPVGVNTKIIRDGVDGYLPTTKHEWVGALTVLVGSQELRQRMGRAGRESAEARFSIQAHVQTMCDVLLETSDRSRPRK